jgi:hypothetical protein
VAKEPYKNGYSFNYSIKCNNTHDYVTADKMLPTNVHKQKIKIHALSSDMQTYVGLQA